MMKRLITAAAILGATSACAFGPGAAGDMPPADVIARPVQLEVTNQSGGPVEVYATASGASYRVGTVHPGLRGRFVVRPVMVVDGVVEFMARSATGHLVRSGPMMVVPGDLVDFALTPHTATSTATVRAWVSGR